jgi:argininosuccinate lyase
MIRAKGRSSATSKGGKAWDGRFKQKTHRLVESFTRSVAVDRRLYAYDIQGSIAHCKTLGKARVLTASETKAIGAAFALPRRMKTFTWRLSDG